MTAQFHIDNIQKKEKDTMQDIRFYSIGSLEVVNPNFKGKYIRTEADLYEALQSLEPIERPTKEQIQNALRHIVPFRTLFIDVFDIHAEIVYYENRIGLYSY